MFDNILLDYILILLDTSLVPELHFLVCIFPVELVSERTFCFIMAC